MVTSDIRVKDNNVHTPINSKNVWPFREILIYVSNSLERDLLSSNSASDISPNCVYLALTRV